MACGKLDENDIQWWIKNLHKSTQTLSDAVQMKYIKMTVRKKKASKFSLLWKKGLHNI